MKELKFFINENINKEKPTLYFPNSSVLGLFIFELNDQITVGKYEDKKTGWEIFEFNINIEKGNPGYKSDLKIYPYSILDIFKKSKNNLISMYHYAKYCKAINDFDTLKNLYVNYDTCYNAKLIINSVSTRIENKESFDDINNYLNENCNFYIKSLGNKFNKLFNKTIYNRYINSSYSLEDTEKDIENLDKIFINRIN